MQDDQSALLMIWLRSETMVQRDYILSRIMDYALHTAPGIADEPIYGSLITISGDPAPLVHGGLPTQISHYQKVDHGDWGVNIKDAYGMRLIEFLTARGIERVHCIGSPGYAVVDFARNLHAATFDVKVLSDLNFGPVGTTREAAAQREGLVIV